MGALPGGGDGGCPAAGLIEGIVGPRRQHGHLESRSISPWTSSMCTVRTEVGWWRSGRTGGASGSETSGKGR